MLNNHNNGIQIRNLMKFLLANFSQCVDYFRIRSNTTQNIDTELILGCYVEGCEL